MSTATAVTPVFRVSARLYAMEAARPRISRAALVAAIPITGLIIASPYDSRFLLVAVMLVFISYQLISLIAWITALSSPDAALRCRPQRWSFEPDGITIEYFDSDEEPETAIDTEILPHDTLDNIEYRGKHAYLFYKDSTKSTVRRSYIITASLIPAGAKLPQQ